MEQFLPYDPRLIGLHAWLLTTTLYSFIWLTVVYYLHLALFLPAVRNPVNTAESDDIMSSCTQTHGAIMETHCPLEDVQHHWHTLHSFCVEFYLLTSQYAGCWTQLDGALFLYYSIPLFPLLYDPFGQICRLRVIYYYWQMKNNENKLIETFDYIQTHPNKTSDSQ